MCTYYYLHYHHVAPCTRGVEYAVQYSFCSNATLESPSETNPLSPTVSHSHHSHPHSHSSSSHSYNDNNNNNQYSHSHFNASSSSSHSQNYDYNNYNYTYGGGSQSHNQGYSQQQQQQQEQQQELVQQPCDSLSHAPESNYNPSLGLEIDYTNPCATGGCLVSQHCATGGCRLEELGGQWVCCRCGVGGNTFRWCVHPMRKVPDALCYHVVCEGCQMDG
jgi:hypothetical protein